MELSRVGPRAVTPVAGHGAASPQRTARPTGPQRRPTGSEDLERTASRARVSDVLHEAAETGARRAPFTLERARLHNDAVHYERVARRLRSPHTPPG